MNQHIYKHPNMCTKLTKSIKYILNEQKTNENFMPRPAHCRKLEPTMGLKPVTKLFEKPQNFPRHPC